VSKQKLACFHEKKAADSLSTVVFAE